MGINKLIVFYKKMLLNTNVLYSLLILISVCSISFAQKENKLIREGNKLYEQKKYNEAINKYEEAIKYKPESWKAQFNKADALYKLEKTEDAANLFQGLAQQKHLSDDVQSEAWYNYGNTLLKQKKYEEAVKAYKQSLKINPNDEDARYNLAYALQKIKQNQNQNNNNKENKENKENKDNKNNKDNKQENKENDEKNKNNSSNNEKDKENENKQQQPKPNPNQMKPEDAKRILDALNRDEKELQNKKRGEAQKLIKVEIEKDW
jgi:tetratricopeptide (TPR) repeat protein